MGAPFPDDPLPVPPPWPGVNSLQARRVAVAESERLRVAGAIREEREAAAQEHGVQGPTKQKFKPTIEPKREREEQIAGVYEEVHTERLRQLFNIYTQRQKAAGKPVKKLNGGKFWFAPAP